MSSPAATNRDQGNKDRECPFCHQAFTSSSLGRHLDLYIRERNPKPPDDVHIVEEIRQLRGNITRRQPRKSGAATNAQRQRSASACRDEDSQASPRRQPAFRSAGGGRTEHGPTAHLNRSKLHATGVINDLPTASQSSRTHWSNGIKAHAGRAHSLGTPGMPNPNTELQERLLQGRAAEYALKEVLESIKMAEMRVRPPQLFNFNFFSLSLPQLYLCCLDAPPSLLAKPPEHPHELAWPLDPPDVSHCETLRDWLASQLASWRLHRERYSSANHLMANATQLSTETSKIQKEEVSYYDHLDSQLRQWAQLSRDERMQAWQRECARAFVKEQEAHQETAAKLEQAKQEISTLKIKLQQLVSGEPDLQRAAILPSAIPAISSSTAAHLKDTEGWDHVNLISKWRSRLEFSSAEYRRPPQTSNLTQRVNHNGTQGNGRAEHVEDAMDTDEPYTSHARSTHVSNSQQQQGRRSRRD